MTIIELVVMILLISKLYVGPLKKDVTCVMDMSTDTSPYTIVYPVTPIFDMTISVLLYSVRADR